MKCLRIFPSILCSTLPHASVSEKDAHLCRAKCLLAMVSTAASQQSDSPRASAHIQSGVGTVLHKTSSKRKREENKQDAAPATSTAAETSAMITGRISAEIQAALTDALDAFHAVHNLACICETRYLQARFFHATVRPEMRDQSSAAFISVEQEISAARNKRLSRDFLDASGLAALVEEWK